MTDRIVTRPATQAYREGWDRVFGGQGGEADQPASKVTPVRQATRTRQSNTGLRPDEFTTDHMAGLAGEADHA